MRNLATSKKRTTKGNKIAQTEKKSGENEGESEGEDEGEAEEIEEEEKSIAGNELEALWKEIDFMKNRVRECVNSQEFEELNLLVQDLLEGPAGPTSEGGDR